MTSVPQCRFIAVPDPRYLFGGVVPSAHHVPSVGWCETHQRPARECQPVTQPEQDSVPQTKPPEGFVPYDHPYWPSLNGWPPWFYSRIEIWRDGMKEPIVVKPSEMHPAMNAAGLYWRPIRKLDKAG